MKVNEVFEFGMPTGKYEIIYETKQEAQEIIDLLEAYLVVKEKAETEAKSRNGSKKEKANGKN